MPIFYTLDRLQTLRENLNVTLVRYSDITPPQLQLYVDELFPEGVSTHGERYFLRNTSRPNELSPSIELLFEYVRRANFPHRPSRFQCMFGFETPNDTVKFREQFGNNQGVIWEISVEQYFKANMSLLRFGDSILLYSYFANKYWAGEAGSDPNPFWEILLIPPIKVIRKISEENRQ